jgi:sec-independent protein translocase protein TatA
MLGLDNPIHIAFLLILLLLVFGAKRLPEMGKSLGAGMRGFKDSLTGESSQPAPTGESTQLALSTQQSATTAPASPPPLASTPAPGPATAPAAVMPPAEKSQPPSAA